MKFLIGQRVIVVDEIGTVQRGSSLVRGSFSEEYVEGYVWVHLPSKGYATRHAEHNVKPLPNGQL